MIRLNKEHLSKDLVAYVVSFCVVVFLLVFVFRIPYLLFGLAGNSKLVDQYYGKNSSYHIVLDCFGILVCLMISKYVYDNYIKDKSIEYGKHLSVVLVASVLSILTCFYMINTKFTNNNVYTKWYPTGKQYAVLYDLVYILSTYIMFEYVREKMN